MTALAPAKPNSKARASMATGVAFGLAAAILWGTADFFFRGATQAGGTFRTLFFDQLVALLFLGMAIAPWYPLSLAGVAPQWIAAAIGVNLAILIGAALLYHAFKVGSLSVVSPIAASFGAIVTALALIFSGERPHPAQLAGIVVTLVGVTLAGAQITAHSTKTRESEPDAKRSRLRLAAGVPEVLIATAIFGVTYWLLRYITPQVGGAQVALIGKLTDIVALSVLLGAVWALRRAPWAVTLTQQGVAMGSAPLVPRGWRFWVWMIPAAIMDVSANVVYNLGVAKALTSVVVTISSLFTAITVLLAWLFLREHLSRWQWVGVALILAGILLVNA
jgi:drug/metabolite transporter (DMT)-like permease